MRAARLTRRGRYRILSDGGEAMIFRKGLSDYKIYEDSRGREAYRYTGDYYALDMPEGKRGAVKAALAAAALLAAVLTFLLGRSARAAFFRLYAVLPFLFAVFFAGWGLSGAFNLALQKEKMTRNQYTIGVKRMTWCALGLAVSAAATLIALIVHHLLEGNGGLPPMALAALLTAVSAGIYLYIHKRICICIVDKTVEK